MTRILFTLFFIFATACDELDGPPVRYYSEIDPMPIYIDSACRPEDKIALETAVELVNDLALRKLGGELVEIIDTVDVDHNAVDVPKHYAACYNSHPDFYTDDSDFAGLLGYARFYHHVRIFRFVNPLGTDDLFQAVAMHELFHYIGVGKTHSNDPDDIMYSAVNGLRTTYSAHDIKMFCEIYDCVD